MNPEDANTFAAIVGLVCNFVQLRSDKTTVNHQAFVEWLAEHRHTELAELITRSVGLQNGINELLRRNHEEMCERIDEACRGIAALLSRVDGFSGIARAAHPGAELSDQAMFFLHQLANSGHDSLILFRGIESLNYEGGEPAYYYEKRFVRSDLHQLAELGLVSAEVNPHGHEVYGITRPGLRFITTSAWAPTE